MLDQPGTVGKRRQASRGVAPGGHAGSGGDNTTVMVGAGGVRGVVCDDAPTFTARIAGIMAEARARAPELGPGADLTVDDRWKGPAYAVSTQEQRKLMVRVARESGLVLDPVYTGKAFLGLAEMVARGEIAQGARVLFLHTGGLPGLLAQGATFAGEL